MFYSRSCVVYARILLVRLVSLLVNCDINNRKKNAFDETNVNKFRVFRESLRAPAVGRTKREEKSIILCDWGKEVRDPLRINVFNVISIIMNNLWNLLLTRHC